MFNLNWYHFDIAKICTIFELAMDLSKYLATFNNTTELKIRVIRIIRAKKIATFELRSKILTFEKTQIKFGFLLT